MKQIFYGPTGYGKSHMILHGLLKKKNLVIITANMSVKSELEYVGINDFPIKIIPISEDYMEKNEFATNLDKTLKETTLGFEVGHIPRIYQAFI